MNEMSPELVAKLNNTLSKLVDMVNATLEVELNKKEKKNKTPKKKMGKK
jgi:hypothetical protein